MLWRDLLRWLVLPSSGALKSGITVVGRVADLCFSSSRLRDQVGLIDESSEMDALCSHVKDTGGVYFVTAFSGLLAP